MKNFESIYKKIYEQYNQETETYRKKSYKKAIIILVIIMAISIIVPLIVYPQIVLITAFAGLLISFIIISVSKISTSYKKYYKSTIIKALVKEYDSNLDFDYTKHISSTLYKSGEFESYDHFSANDYIFGKIDGIIPFELGDVHTTIESTDSDGNTTESTVFRGLFSSGTLNCNLSGKIKLRSDKGFLGKLIHNKQLMQMDSQEFEKHFDVYTDNKILAMQLLTSDIMDYLINFKTTNKIKFEFTLKGNHLYSRLWAVDMFEGALSKNALDYKTLQKYYNALDFMCILNKKIYDTIKEKNL